MNNELGTLQDPNTVVVDLDFGITRGTDVIKSITLRKPKTGSLRGLNLNEVLNIDINAHIKLLPRITNPAITAAEVADLDPADFTTLASGVVGFFVSQKVKAESQPS